MADQQTSQPKDKRPRFAMDVKGYADDENQMKKGQLMDIIKTYEDTGHVRVRSATGQQMVLGPEYVA